MVGGHEVCQRAFQTNTLNATKASGWREQSMYWAKFPTHWCVWSVRGGCWFWT